MATKKLNAVEKIVKKQTKAYNIKVQSKRKEELKKAL